MPILPKLALRKLEPYVRVLEGRLGKVRLDMNENTTKLALSTIPNASNETESFQDWFGVYPEYSQLEKSMGELFQLDPQQILLTNGSNEGFNVVASTFVEPAQTKAIVSRPCFAMITHSLRIAGAQLIEIPVLPNLEFNVKGIESALGSGADLAIFASPDNPTGAVLLPETISSWCKNFPQTLFVIDQAYSEYSGITVLPLLSRFKNLLIIKTFSKAWGMAGLRLGVVLGNADLIAYLKLVRLPYSINTLAVNTAQMLISQSQNVIDNVQYTMQRKTSLMEDLKRRQYKIIAGNANFFLMYMGKYAAEFCSYLHEQNILVRNRSTGNTSEDNPMFGYVRISIGTQEELRLFLQAVDIYSQREQNIDKSVNKELVVK